MDQEADRFSLNLLTWVVQHLAQEGHAKEGRGGKTRNKPKNSRKAYKLVKEYPQEETPLPSDH